MRKDLMEQVRDRIYPTLRTNKKEKLLKSSTVEVRQGYHRERRQFYWESFRDMLKREQARLR